MTLRYVFFLFLIIFNRNINSAEMKAATKLVKVKIYVCNLKKELYSLIECYLDQNMTLQTLLQEFPKWPNFKELDITNSQFLDFRTSELNITIKQAIEKREGQTTFNINIE